MAVRRVIDQIIDRGGSETCPYWIVALAGLTLRLIIAPWGGHPGDLASLANWAAELDAHGLSAVYMTSDANYPPLALAILAISRWGYGAMGGGDLAGPLWWMMLKLPPILADMGIALLIGRLAQRCREPFWPMASMALNPALIYLSAWWGQYESLYMLGALASLVAAIEHRSWWAGIALALGMMVKLQAVAIAPLVILLVLASPQRIVPLLQFGLGLALQLVLSLGPFVWLGQGELVARRLVAVIAGPNWLTINALNVWYLATGSAGNWAYNAPVAWPDTTPVAAGIPARMIGTVMLAVWVIGVLALAWRALSQASSSSFLSEGGDDKKSQRDEIACLAGALLYLGMFLWPTQAHERYAFGAVVLLAGAAAADEICVEGHVRLSHSVLLYMLMTVACMLNLIWAAPFAVWLEGWFAGESIIGMGIASAFVVAAAWGCYRLYQLTSS
ncbi:MAG: hypothetical protein JXB30_19265 [Anaerolineae bacterium]|nr:hypothetical protein [Anaerolineae bacterium]